MSETPKTKNTGVKTSGRVLLLDASAFIAGYEASDVDAVQYTVPSVREELKQGSFPRIRFDNAVRNRRLKILAPNAEYVVGVREVIKEMGEEGVLSEVDSQLLSLGLQLKSEGLEPVIITDDYSIQNVSDRLGIGFRAMTTHGIKRQFEWTIYCPGCRRTFPAPQPDGVCPVCGTELKRRPGRKRSLSERA
jgi:UPF0271 protein